MTWSGFRDTGANTDGAVGAGGGESTANTGEEAGADDNAAIADGAVEAVGAGGGDSTANASEEAGADGNADYPNSPGLKFHVYITPTERGVLNISSYVGTHIDNSNWTTISDRDPKLDYWVHVIAEDAAGNKSEPVTTKSDKIS